MPKNLILCLKESKVGIEPTSSVWKTVTLPLCYSDFFENIKFSFFLNTLSHKGHIVLATIFHIKKVNEVGVRNFSDESETARLELATLTSVMLSSTK